MSRELEFDIRELRRLAQVADAMHRDEIDVDDPELDDLFGEGFDVSFQFVSDDDIVLID